jgi:hypothetical protein
VFWRGLYGKRAKREAKGQAKAGRCSRFGLSAGWRGTLPGALDGQGAGPQDPSRPS